MNEIQKDKIKKLAYDKSLLNALKALAKEVIKSDNILKEVDMHKSDEFVGQQMKAVKIASNMVKNIFKEIESYKEIKVEDNLKEEGNPAY